MSSLDTPLLRPHAEAVEDSDAILRTPSPRGRLDAQRYTPPDRALHGRRHSDIFAPDLDLSLHYVPRPGHDSASSGHRRDGLRIRTEKLEENSVSLDTSALTRDDRGRFNNSGLPPGLERDSSVRRKTSVKLKEALKRGWTPSLRTESDEITESTNADAYKVSPMESALTQSFLDHRQGLSTGFAKSPTSPASPSPDRRTRRRAETLLTDVQTPRFTRGFLSSLLRLKKSNTALRTRKRSPIEERSQQTSLSAESVPTRRPDHQVEGSAVPLTPSKSRSFASIFTGRHAGVTNLSSGFETHSSPSHDSLSGAKIHSGRKGHGEPLRLVTSNIPVTGGALSAPPTTRRHPPRRPAEPRIIAQDDSPTSAGDRGPYSPFSVSQVAKPISPASQFRGTPIAPFSDLVKLSPSASHSPGRAHGRGAVSPVGLSAPSRMTGRSRRHLGPRAASPASQSSSSAVLTDATVERTGTQALTELR